MRIIHKKLVFFYLVPIVLLFHTTWMNAQKFSDIKGDASFIWGEGAARDTHTSDSLALDALLNKIALTIDLPYDLDVKEALMNTYREDVFSCSEFSVVSRRGEVSVLRYIGQSSLDSVFEKRRERISEMKSVASTAEEKLQMDVAMRYLSWAAVLMQSVPGFKAEEVAELRSRRIKLLDGMNVAFARQNIADKSVVELSFTYKDVPVRNIDYRFFNGKQWSEIMSAKDGMGFIEVNPDSRIEDYRILYESDPSSMRHIYREVQAVERAFSLKNTVNGNANGRGFVAKNDKEMVDASSIRKIDMEEVKNKVLDVMSQSKFKSSSDSVSLVHLTPTLFTSKQKESVTKICDAITTKEYESVHSLFTDNGYDVFLRLVAYGHARVLSYGELNFYSLDGETYCRSVPMVFSFSGNMRQFVEDIVFIFDENGLVSDLTFSLGKAATSDICSHEGWSEEARLILVSFLENYKTAYALKRLDYISSIFDDDALIITGRVLKKTDIKGEWNDNEYVRFTRQNKDTYIRNLSRVFSSQEYINIQFSDSEVIKLGKGEQLFGIKIRQEYFSTTYSDVGYLFILVDVSDYKSPVIHVRTWQDSPDKNFGIIGPYHF